MAARRRRRGEVLLSISEAAALAGVTVRAVRHYHQRGLLPEPPRDASGYRRYDPDAVFALIRIRALSQAGVPLARVAVLLRAEAEEFAAALAEIDADLDAEIRRLEEHRKAVAELGTPEGLALPDEAVAFLDRMRSLGLSERVVEIERNGWLLMSAHVPDQVRTWIAQKHAVLDDPEMLRTYRLFDEAYDLLPGDPRLEALADRLIAEFQREDAKADPPPEDVVDDTVAAVLDWRVMRAAPGWRHLGTLLEERGWRGWARVEPSDGDE